MTYERIFLKYIKQYTPDMETSRIIKATKIFSNCVKHKEDIFFALDDEFFAIEKELPIIVAKKFQKRFYKNFEERDRYELKGNYVSNGILKEITPEDFPYHFTKNTVKAKLEKCGTISNNMLFYDLMFLPTGKMTEINEKILYRSYLMDFYEVLEKILTPYLEKVISEYAKEILKYPYDHYEDIKEVVNRAVFEQLCGLTMFRLFEDADEFIKYFGWKNKTIDDILTIAKC